jgi:hypothetical protein
VGGRRARKRRRVEREKEHKRQKKGCGGARGETPTPTIGNAPDRNLARLDHAVDVAQQEK